MIPRYDSLVLLRPAIDSRHLFLVWCCCDMMIYGKERSLLQRVTNGDVEAWQEFIKSYADCIYKAASHYADDRDERMEIFTQVLERLKYRNFEKLRHFGFKAKLSTWLTVLARNLTIDFLRSTYGRDFRLKKIRVLSYDQNPEGSPELADQRDPELNYRTVEQQQTHEKMINRLEGFLKNLDDRDVLLIRFVYFRGLKIGEAGALLGIPSVYKSLGRVLGKLRKQFECDPALSKVEIDEFLQGAIPWTGI